MYCSHCRACGTQVAGNTPFAQLSKHFKRESIKIHCQSAKHRKCRDKCLAQRNKGPIVSAFQRQHANQANQLEELKI